MNGWDPHKLLHEGILIVKIRSIDISQNGEVIDS